MPASDCFQCSPALGIQVVFHDFQVNIGWTQQLFVRLPIFPKSCIKLNWMLHSSSTNISQAICTRHPDAWCGFSHYLHIEWNFEQETLLNFIRIVVVYVFSVQSPNQHKIVPFSATISNGNVWHWSYHSIFDPAPEEVIIKQYTKLVYTCPSLPIEP